MGASTRVNLEELADLQTPWCVHVVATLRIAEHVAAGRACAADLAAATGCDADALACVLGHLRGLLASIRRCLGGVELGVPAAEQGAAQSAAPPLGLYGEESARAPARRR